jgi:hypothetical protein
VLKGFVMSSLRLEGFDEGIRGHRCLVIGKESDWIGRIDSLESESLYKGRSVLVIHEPVRSAGGSGGTPGFFRKRWDCVFRIRESFEAQMLATYVANAPKPVRILWYSAAGQEIPRALWQKWTPSSDVSLIGCSDKGELLGCEWEVIFFPLQNTPQFTEKVLGMRGTGMRSLATNVSSHLSEITEKGAALVWSNIDETDNRGCLYWYDPSDVAASPLLTKPEAVSIIDELKKWILKH